MPLHDTYMSHIVTYQGSRAKSDAARLDRSTRRWSDLAYYLTYPNLTHPNLALSSCLL